jgi:hypothetical protein
MVAFLLYPYLPMFNFLNRIPSTGWGNRPIGKVSGKIYFSEDVLKNYFKNIRIFLMIPSTTVFLIFVIILRHFNKVITLMMEAVSSSEKSSISTRLHSATSHIPGDSHLHTRSRENLKYQKGRTDHIVCAYVTWIELAQDRIQTRTL